MVKSIGISGTRERMTLAQEHAMFHEIIQQIRLGATEVHHGACIGVDQAMHFRMLGQIGVFTHVHPPLDPKYSAFPELMRHARRVDHEPLPYKERNQEIVDAADVLIAAPLFPEDDARSKRSGTWQTVRMAKAKSILTIVIDRNGKVETYHNPGIEKVS